MKRSQTSLSVTAAVIASALGIAACHYLPDESPRPDSGRAVVVQKTAGGAAAGPPASAMPRATAQSRPAFPARLPGLGLKTSAHVPRDTRQVLLVTGAGKTSASAKAVLWQRVDGGWRPGAVWAAHNGYRGWTGEHHAGDLRSPIGVFGLTDAGGRLADPGGKLPYHRSGAFRTNDVGLEGESLQGVFDYVIAIDYNRLPGTSPMDGTRPLGENRGGGIWIHVDHGGPTHACISISKAHMKQLLRTLDPADHPVVVMGDAASLAR
ncbi:L,D-transpeptidase family protein [Streptomyces sp. NPDC048663]|uniref:L,D-transpeptidase family protein n=1 Tax=Streptomyces sp. NPDC048663 TaxID=3155638 RepID=UPI00341BC93F